MSYRAGEGTRLLSKIHKRIVRKNAPFVITCVQSSGAAAPALQIADEQEIMPVSNDAQLVDQAQEEARLIVQRAQQEARKILDQAKGETENLRQTAQQQGQQQGYEAGLSQGRNEGEAAVRQEMQNTIKETAQKAASLMQTVEKDRVQSIVAAERKIVQLALEVAQHILQREIQENPTVILPIVRAALTQVTNQEQVQVRVHPDDFAFVHAALPELEKLFQNGQAVQVLPDATVTRGGCILDTPYGMLDAQIDTQFDAVRKALEAVTP